MTVLWIAPDVLLGTAPKLDTPGLPAIVPGFNVPNIVHSFHTVPLVPSGSGAFMVYGNPRDNGHTIVTPA
jgi:hypothetical protein